MHSIYNLQSSKLRAIKLVITINTSSTKREFAVQRLKLPTLRFRRIRGDMIEVYKIPQKSKFARRTASG